MRGFVPEKGFAVDDVAIEQEGAHAPGVPDIDAGISVENEDVGAAPRGDKTKLVPVELERVVVGGGG
jgi:hypothetical protein